jgi:prepilin-type N-terminal cleavage/methylation domain-containing protein
LQNAIRRPEDKKKQNMKNDQDLHEAGFTLVEIMIVMAIIGLLAGIAIPNYVKARSTSQATTCINNLRQIDSAAQQFALEQRKRTGQGINFPADLTPYIKLNANNSIPPCPANGAYTCATVGNEPTCSLSSSTIPPHVLE